MSFGGGDQSGQQPSSGGGGGGWGLNPLTDIMKATSSLGSWVDSWAHIGSFNPGIGSAVSTAANILPGLANIGVKLGEASFGNENAFHDLQQAGTQFGHGISDTLTDVGTLGGLAPWTKGFERGYGNTFGYQPQGLAQYATQPGQGLGGAAMNDVMNALLVADGAGAMAKAGPLGEAAMDAAKVGTDAAAGAVDVGVPAGSAITDAQHFGREARIQQIANESATSTGADPDVLATQIRARLQGIDRINSVRDKLSLPLRPTQAVAELGRAATERLGGTGGPETPTPTSESPTGASQGTSQPVQNAPVQKPNLFNEAFGSQNVGIGEPIRPEAPPIQPGEPTTTLYRGESPENVANKGEAGDAGRWFTDNPDLAREMYARENGTVYKAEVPNRVLDESKAQGGDAYGKLWNADQTVSGNQYRLPEEYRGTGEVHEGPQGSVLTAEAPEVNPKEFISADAKQYAEQHGLPEPKPVDLTSKVDPLRGNMIARLFKLAESRPDDPAVVKSYTAMARDVTRQWDFLKSKGVNVIFQDRGEGPGAYANAAEMMRDVQDNNRLIVDRTGPGEQHLMPQMNNVIDHDAAGNPITVNDAFRAVHDYFGHYDAGNDFGRHGEDVAWRLHSPMFSADAQPALFTETVGQNSFLNFANENVDLKRVGLNPQFPEQKATLLPELVRQPDWRPAGPAVADAMANSLPHIEGVPKYYETFLERSTPTPRWAQAVVNNLPEPLVKLLAWTDHLRLAHADKVIQRQTVRAIAVEARRIENSPQITALKQQAQQLIVDRIPGVTPGIASDIVGERVRAALVLGPEWHQLEALRPEIESVAPGLTDHVLSFVHDLPEEHNTPEFRQTIEQLAEPIRQMRIEAQKRMANSSFLGDRGLQNVDLETPVMTAQETRWHDQVQTLVHRATNLETEGVAKDLTDTTRQILDQVDIRSKAIRDAQLAEEAGAQALTDINRNRTYVPWAFQSDARLAQMADDVTQRIVEQGGATYDPHYTGGRFLEMRDPDLSGYVVGGVQGSAMQIPEDEFMSVNPDTGRLRGSEAVEAMARSFQNVYQLPDMMIGGWREDGVVHLDPSQFLEGSSSRDHAISLGAARQQLSITELHTGDFIPTNEYDPNIAAHFVGKGTYAARDARAAELRRISDTQAANGERALAQNDIDHIMAWTDLQAVRASQLHPERYPTPDAYYRQAFRSEYAQRGVKGDFVLNEVRPMVNDPKVLKAMVRDMVLRQAPESQWYYHAHDYIDPVGDQLEKELGPVQLGLGTPWSAPKEISPKELLYNFVAIMSMNTDPAQNWTWALGGVRNFVDVMKNRLPELRDAVKEWTELSQGERTPIENKGYVPKLVKLLSEPDTNQLARRYYLAVLDGHTIETWDADFFRNSGQGKTNVEDGLFANYGNVSANPLSERNLKQEVIDRLSSKDEAVMELHGSKAAAKIRSFYDNLKNPSTSMLVTNDSWMARLFGERDTFWGNVGRWHSYAELIRGIASDLSKEAGRTVMPHEVQAALWFWTKNNYADINAAAVRGMGAEAMRAVANGSWSRTTDPLGQFWADAERHAQTIKQPDEGVVTPTQLPMLRKPLEPETVEKGGEIPPTQTEEVQYRHPRATSTGRITEEGNSVTLQRGEYERVMDKVDASLAQGDEEEARYAIWNYLKQNDAEWESRKDGLQFWDAPSRPSWEPFSQSLADILGIHVAGGPLAEMFDKQLLGQFVPSPGVDQPALIRMFQQGDFTTLLHEHGHLLQSLLTNDELAQMEQHYHVVRGRWTTQAQENFIHDMLASAVGFEGDSPVKGVLDHLRANIAEHYQAFGQTFNAAGLHPEVANFWGHILAPELDNIQAPSLNVDGTNLIGHEGTIPDESHLTPAQQVARTPKIPVDESTTQTYRRGVRSQEALDEWRQQMIRRKEAQAAAVRASKTIDDLTRMINEKMLPSQIEAAGLREDATNLSDKLADSLQDPSRERTPALFQPMVEAGKRMADAVEQYPELETLLEPLPKIFGDAIDYAYEHDWQPTHMPDMRPERVRQLVNGTVRLSGEPGKQFVSGGRKLRTGALAAQDLQSRSIETIIAGIVDSTAEERTNQIVDWIDRVAAQDIPTQANRRILPSRSMVEWDPIRRGLLATETPEGEKQVLGGPSTKMIPRAVANAIREYQTMGSNPLARAMQAATDPWRFFMLTLNPAFYLRHFTGHVLLAAANEGGFNMNDWRQAFQSARNKFADLPEVTGLNITQAELGQPGIVTYPSMQDAFAQGGTKAGLAYVADQLHKSVAVSDSFARAVVYFSDIRKGASSMEAMQHAMDALVDYGNLSDTERYFARSLIPFYGFEKGVLKTALKLPIDHPLVTSVLMKIGQWQGEQAKDDNGNPLPAYYQGIVDVPGLGKVNLRSFSPFKDLGSLTTTDGLVGSLQYAVKAVIESGMNSAPPGLKPGTKVDQYGHIVPDVQLPAALANAAFSSPQGNLVEGLSGNGPKSPAQSLAGFFGIPTVSDKTANNAGQSNVLNQAMVGNATQQQQQQAAGNAVDTNMLQNKLSQSLANGQQVPTAPGSPGITQPTQQQVQAALTAAQDKQQAAAAKKRAANKGGGGSHKTHGAHKIAATRSRRSSGTSSRSRRGGSSSGRAFKISAQAKAHIRQAFGKSANAQRSGGAGHSLVKSPIRGVPGLKGRR